MGKSRVCQPLGRCGILRFLPSYLVFLSSHSVAAIPCDLLSHARLPQKLSNALSYIFYVRVSLAGISCRHYSYPDNTTELVASCALSGYVKLSWLSEAVGWKFSHRPGNPATIGVVRCLSAGDTVGCRLCWPKLTPVDLISMVQWRCGQQRFLLFYCIAW